MEGKKLNLNQPLLSVRKYSPNVASKTVDDKKIRHVIPRTPPYRSELKSGPVGNPAAVPFQWEQIPGRPKEEIKQQIQNTKPPPKAKKYDSHQVFLRAIDNKIKAVNIDHDSLTGSSMDVRINNLERSKEKKEENKDSSPGDRDEAYVEALESFFLHCGTNGNFSMDPKTREFIKDKFLPRYASNEESPVQEEEKSDDECEQHVNLPAVCCLLPRFCLKSSICILNPVPAMSMRTRVLTSPANRIQPRSSLANEQKFQISELKPVEKSSKNESSQLKSQDTSTHCEDKDVFALPEETGIEGFQTFQELLTDQGSLTEVKNMRYCSIDTHDTEINTKATNQKHVKDSSHDDFKKIVSSVNKLDGARVMETSKGSRENQDCKQDSTTAENMEMSEKQRVSTFENCHEKYSDCPVLPPLRSPSDSWLRRTLPSNLASAKYPRYKKAISSRKLRLNRTKV